MSLLKMAPMLEKGRMAIISRGRSLGSFTYVENLADGLILAATRKEASGRTYVITDGVKMTWQDYFDRLTGALEVPPVRLSLPAPLVWCVASLLEWVYRLFRLPGRPFVTRYLVAHLRVDFHFTIERARKELGYEPAVSVDEAIRRTARWYRQSVRGESAVKS